MKFIAIYNKQKGAKSIEEGISGHLIDILERRSGAKNLDQRSKAIKNIPIVFKKLEVIYEHYMAYKPFADAVGA